MNEEELNRLRLASLYYCDKLLNDIKVDQEDINQFFGGEIYKAYNDATEKVLNKAKNIRAKIRNL